MYRRAIALAWAALLVAAVLMTPGSANAAAGSCVPPPVAHRGDSHVAPENTRPAFRSALRGGVRILEMDVRFTQDGTPVLMHDSTLDRTTNGTGPVNETSLAVLRSLDAGSWHSARYIGTSVPTLYEALKDGVRYRARYLVELKVRPTPEQLDSVLDRFDRLGLRDRVVVTSRDTDTLQDVRAAAPDLRTAIVDNPIYREPSLVLRHGSAYVVSHRAVTPERALSWRESGIEVYSWTLDTRSGWLRMADEVVAGTITNRPVRYLAWARSFCG